ncbi:PQQ-binding-like beta-propeller repeat protein [Actinoallomurus sp. NPDC050550]|uniref:outer membrane protein assembly factor BamB family protein n=1 Tax=Actinoallomurus sp. NPDC050550 TaxID=3154937 RepID=UPI0033D49E06
MENETDLPLAAAGEDTDAPRPPQRTRRSRWLTAGVPAFAAVLILAGTGTWLFSPWEHLSGAHGTPPRSVSGVPSSGARRFRDAADPILAAGALVERHDGGVRAVDLRTGRTWWGISRPGRVRVDAVGRVDGRRAAVVWSDRGLTIVDVRTGHRVHADLPDRSFPKVDSKGEEREVPAGLTGPAGRPLVAVVQDRGVDAYDASSGRRVWSHAAPHDCVFGDPVGKARTEGSFLPLDVACADGPPSPYDPQYAYSTLLDASSGRAMPGFERLPGGSLLPVGDHELLQNEVENGLGRGYRVLDSRTGRPLWHVDSGAYAGVAGGDGLVVVTEHDDQITAYRAADGKRLWRRTFSGAGDQLTRLRSGTVIGGQVRVVELEPRPIKVFTFDSAGKTTGIQELPMFERGGDPGLVGGDFGTLVVEDENVEPNDKLPPYVLLTATG